MKKKMATFLAMVLLLFLFAGCGTQSPQANSGDGGGQDEKLKVVTTIFPIYDFVRAVGGDRVEVTMLLPPGSESHSYEPTPRDMITIQESDLFIYVGGESDDWVNQVLTAGGNEEVVSYKLMDMVTLVDEELVEGMEPEEEEEHGHEEGEAEEASSDEHVWTSPQNAITIVGEIQKALSKADANGAAEFEANAKSYQEKLQLLDKKFIDVVKNAKRKTLIFGDRFPFRYFTDAYGLTYYAAFLGCSTETEPSARTVAFLIDKIKAESIPAVLHIEFGNEKMADAIAEETGAKKLRLHACHNVSPADIESGTTYLQLMEENVTVLQEALN